MTNYAKPKESPRVSTVGVCQDVARQNLQSIIQQKSQMSLF